MGASTGANNGAAFYRRAPLELENPPHESLRLEEKVERRRSEEGVANKSSFLGRRKLLFTLRFFVSAV